MRRKVVLVDRLEHRPRRGLVRPLGLVVTGDHDDGARARRFLCRPCLGFAQPELRRERGFLEVHRITDDVRTGRIELRGVRDQQSDWFLGRRHGFAVGPRRQGTRLRSRVERDAGDVPAVDEHQAQLAAAIRKPCGFELVARDDVRPARERRRIPLHRLRDRSLRVARSELIPGLIVEVVPTRLVELRPAAPVSSRAAPPVPAAAAALHRPPPRTRRRPPTQVECDELLKARCNMDSLLMDEGPHHTPARRLPEGL